MRPLLVVLAALAAVLPPPVAAQPLPYPSAAAFEGALRDACAGADPAAGVDAVLDRLAAADRFPFAAADTAVMLYRGTVSSVTWNGDFNGWGGGARVAGARVPGCADVWTARLVLPPAARVDYKIVRNGSDWILDPLNPHQQWSGFGPNSELRMPEWVFAPETVHDPDAPVGEYRPAQLLASAALGYDVRYRVYLPAGWDTLGPLPVLYVTDGHEYADDRLGALRIVLDNLTAWGDIRPVIAVFIDPRDPVSGANRRQEQYVQNPDFVAFVADELAPAVDAAFPTQADRDGRAILGTSLGGLFSTYLGLLRPEAFAGLAIQSPAYWVSERADWWTGPSIYQMVADADTTAFVAHMATGTIQDTEDGARRMRAVMEGRGAALTYVEVPEGHSWGNWRAVADEALRTLFPAATTGADPAPARPGLGLSAAPNPATDSVTLHVALEAQAAASLLVFDATGRRVAAVHDGPLAAGRSTFAVPTAGWAAGTYVARLLTPAGAAATVFTVLRR